MGLRSLSNPPINPYSDAMERIAGIVLRWGGRALILLAVFVLVSSFFLPSAIQPLNGLVCPAGTELSNARATRAGAPDNERLELVCTSPTYSESAARGILLVSGGLLAGGLLALYLRRRLLTPRYRAPTTPQPR